MSPLAGKSAQSIKQLRFKASNSIGIWPLSIIQGLTNSSESATLRRRDLVTSVKIEMYISPVINSLLIIVIVIGIIALSDGRMMGAQALTQA